MLFIENNTLLMQEINISKIEYNAEYGTKIKGILGFIQIYPCSYLFVVTGHKKVYEISLPKRIRIYEITDTDLLIIHKESSNENFEYKKAILKIMK